ncbi:ATP-binding protein [Plantactinospora soyae]|uniref:ATPase n=1 Tax=Plantactinospora soyae TaxID=1544732 RepID=A0A927R3Z3_9ACTN|nr:BTAD domain-containing putative transcriptional regulator [Plantactinospora soyae]MBE1492298.1 putative ATPase [Plantactinospora soyae]
MRHSVPGQQANTDRPVTTGGEVRLLGPVRLIGPDGPVALPDESRLLLGLLALRAGEPVPDAELLAAIGTSGTARTRADDPTSPCAPVDGPGHTGAAVDGPTSPCAAVDGPGHTGAAVDGPTSPRAPVDGPRHARAAVDGAVRADVRILDRPATLLAAALADCGSPDALEIGPAGYRLRLPGSRIDAHRFIRLVARARRRMAAGDLPAAGRLFGAALATWSDPATPGPGTGLVPDPAVVTCSGTLPPGARPEIVPPSVTCPGTGVAPEPAVVTCSGTLPPGARPEIVPPTVPGSPEPTGQPLAEAGGEPLRGHRLCPSGWAAVEVRRLRQARFDAFEDRWECLLRLAVSAYAAAGGPVADRSVVAAGAAGTRLARTAVGELSVAVAGRPLRARLWELLLVASFLADGRRAAAQVQRRAREVFSEQLGVEPAGRICALAEAAQRGELPEDWATGQRGEPVPEAGTGRPASRARAAARLPVPLTALLGREDLLDVVGQRLDQHRLVSLTGTGGAGKTRLAVAAAGRVTDRPVWFVDLTAVESPVRVPQAVAAALGVPDLGRDLVEALVADLGAVPALLVLDNCEHLVTGCAELVGRLLSQCPGLRVLATSRVALRVPGESRIRVPALAVPEPASGHDIAALRAHPATRLFLERAHEFSGRPVPEASAEAVVRLCAELDGLPLAIELAAARTPMLSVNEITTRLRADVRLLRSSDPRTPDRHRSIAAAVESSLAQLEPDACRLFDRLSICAGGFDAELAEAMGGASAPADLAALVEASLAEPLPGEPAESSPTSGQPSEAMPVRYRMLAPIRRHALSRLVASGAEVAARQDLATYCLGLAERADAQLRGAVQDRWLSRLRAEDSNLRSAMTWLAEAGAGGPVHGDLRLATALSMYCRLEGHYRDGHRWLAGALARHPAAPPALRARAGIGAAMLAMLRCDYPAAIEHAKLARTACRGTGDRRTQARVELILGSVAREQARYAESARHLATAGAIFAECDDEWGEAQTTELRGFTAWLAGDLDRAYSRLRASLRRHERLGDALAAASALMNLGAVALYQGDIDRASSLLDVALRRHSAIGFPEGVGWAHNLRGLVELRGGRTRQAAGHLRISLAEHRRVGDLWRTASVLEALAEVARLEGEPIRGARLLGAADRIRAEIGAPVPACERPDAEATERALRAQLDGPTRSRRAGRTRAEGRPGAGGWPRTTGWPGPEPDGRQPGAGGWRPGPEADGRRSGSGGWRPGSEPVGWRPEADGWRLGSPGAAGSLLGTGAFAVAHRYGRDAPLDAVLAAVPPEGDP